jgi:hypothetical protein
MVIIPRRLEEKWGFYLERFNQILDTHKKWNIKTSVLTTFVWQGLDKAHGLAYDWIWLQLRLWIGLVQQYLNMMVIV